MSSNLFNVPDKADKERKLKKKQSKREKKKEIKDAYLSQRFPVDENDLHTQQLIHKPEDQFIEKNKAINQQQQSSLGFKIHLNAYNSVLSPEELKQLTIEESRYYKVLGDTKILHVRDGYLSDKINEISDGLKFQKQQNQVNNLQAWKSKKDLIQNQQINNKDDDCIKNLFEIDKNNRYFQLEQKLTLFCKRCKKAGHFERMCVNEIKMSCYYCLGNHSAFECKQRICFNCNQLGHINKECPFQNKQRCQRCQKVGHKKVDCGAILLSKVFKEPSRFMSTVEDEWVKTDDNKVKCLVCKRKGHLSCQDPQKTSEKDQIIYDKKFRESIIKCKRNEEIKQLKGTIINFHFSDSGNSDSETDYLSKSSKQTKPKSSSSLKSEKSTKTKEIKEEDEDIQIHVEKIQRVIPQSDQLKTKPKKNKKNKLTSDFIADDKSFIEEEKEERDEIEDENRFENLLALNMIHEENSFISDVYLSDINEDDYDYGRESESEGQYEKRRNSKIKQKRQDADRMRDRSNKSSKMKVFKSNQKEKNSQYNSYPSKKKVDSNIFNRPSSKQNIRNQKNIDRQPDDVKQQNRYFSEERNCQSANHSTNFVYQRNRKNRTARSMSEGRDQSNYFKNQYGFQEKQFSSQQSLSFSSKTSRSEKRKIERSEQISSKKFSNNIFDSNLFLNGGNVKKGKSKKQ